MNIGLIGDISRSLDRGAEGIGLFRTEVPFMTLDRFPDRRRTTRHLSRAHGSVQPASGDDAHARHRRRQGAVVFPDQGRQPVPRLARHSRHARSPGDFPRAGARDDQVERGPEQPAAHHVADDLEREGSDRRALADPPRVRRGGRRRHRRADAGDRRDDRSAGRGVSGASARQAGRLSRGGLERPDAVHAGGRSQQPARRVAVSRPASGGAAGAARSRDRRPRRRQGRRHLRRTRAARRPARCCVWRWATTCCR